MEDSDSPASVYGRQLTAAFRSVLKDRLLAAYLHGSGAMGGWIPGRSDIDLLFVMGAPLAPGDVEPLAAIANRVACPGTGVELSFVLAPVVLAEGLPPFELHLCTGPGAKVVPGAGHPGDADLVMHFAVCLARGVTLDGPAPHALLPSVPRRRLLGAFLDELRWAATEAPRHYAVLNACRAICFAETGELIAKLQAPEWAARAGFQAALARAAWNHHASGSGAPLEAGAVRAALDEAAKRVRGALEREP